MQNLTKRISNIQVSLSKFYKKYPYLQIQELIEFYSVFEGIDGLKPDLGLIENIKNIYLLNYEKLKDRYIYVSDESLQKDIQNALTRLSRGDRKRFSIYKDISQPQGKQVYKILFDNGIIKEEFSREKPLWLDGRKIVKKSLRRYKVESKISFINESTRFWFNFIAPNENSIKNGDFKETLRQIELHVDKHLSLSFEFLCSKLIERVLPENSIVSNGSFWAKNSEIDLLTITDELVIVGESKYKNSKICKNVLNSLKKKAEFANLEPTHFALFSKSGFSNEVLNIKDKNLMLFALEDFERLL